MGFHCYDSKHHRWLIGGVRGGRRGCRSRPPGIQESWGALLPGHYRRNVGSSESFFATPLVFRLIRVPFEAPYCQMSNICERPQKYELCQAEKKRRLFIIQNKQDANDSERAEYKSCFMEGRILTAVICHENQAGALINIAEGKTRCPTSSESDGPRGVIYWFRFYPQNNKSTSLHDWWLVNVNSSRRANVLVFRISKKGGWFAGSHSSFTRRLSCLVTCARHVLCTGRAKTPGSATRQRNLRLISADSKK